MSNELEQAATKCQEELYDGYYSGHIEGYQNAFKAGAEWQKKQVSEYLDKWMEHATRGSEKGNHIYHLGKIALILDIQEWLKEDKETPSNSVEV